MGAAVDHGVRNRPAGRWLKPDRYHMTLHFLGSFPHIDANLSQARVRVPRTA